jgi:tRNA/tmRNA/rRNA uracil-C5-methylase (TrmA/RlmC/RlmD family)
MVAPIDGHLGYLGCALVGAPRAQEGHGAVGFHERKSRYVADMRECHVLPPHVSALMLP